MPSTHLKNFKEIWTNTCHTMWIEILSLRSLEGFLKGRYAKISPEANLTDIIYAPECRGRIDGVDKDHILKNIDHFLQYNIPTTRVVLLSAAFESYFGGFLEDYIQHRPKYFDDTARQRTAKGNQLYGDVHNTRGIVPKIEKFSELTGAKIKKIQPLLPILNEVYQLRNVIAHRAGVCDNQAVIHLNVTKCTVGSRIMIPPDLLIGKLAPPCLEIAKNLDDKIQPESRTSALAT